MKKLAIFFLLSGLLMSTNTSGETRVFPYNYYADDLPNGLRVVTVPTDYPNIVALYIVVGAGSRNEVEPGKSGFAHLFEHLMFRGTEKTSPKEYNAALKNAGADSNAYTSDDRTVYYTVFSKEDCETIMALEADRFQNLKVPEALFKTETRAVLGEYNKNASSPVRKLYEVLRDTAFDSHTYKHTTMGYLRDVENMPSQYEYSLEFFKRYYRPEYTTIVVAGDVKRDAVLQLVKKYWGNWQHGSYVPEIPTEPEQKGERHANVDWPPPTLPWVAVSYKGPAYSDVQKDQPALDLIASLAFSQNSELYQRLVIKEQKVDALEADFESHRDPYLVTVLARVKDSKDVEYVKGEIIKTFESYRTQAVARDKLDTVKSNLRYAFALSLDSSDSIAANLAPFIALRRTPETIDKVFEIYSSVDPGDVQGMAKKYFVSERRTVVTLSHKEKQENATRK